MATEGLVVRRISWALPVWLRSLLALTLVAVLLFLLALGLRATRLSLHIDEDGVSTHLHTHAQTVSAALHGAGIGLYPEDQVTPPLDAAVEPGMIIQIKRAMPVALTAEGQVRQLRTHAVTVGDLLAEAGVPAGAGDEIRLNGAPSSPAAPLGTGAAVRLRRAHTVNLRSGGGRQTIHTTDETVGELLEDHGIALYPEDRVSPGMGERLQEGMTIVIERSLPVRFEVDGRTLRGRTLSKTVAQALAEAGIALVGQDVVQPALSAPIRSAMTIRITRVREAIEVAFEEIPFVTIWVADAELEIDHTRLAQEGQEGMFKRRYRVRYEDGQEVGRVLEDAWQEQAPITKTLAYGTKIVVRTLELADGTTLEYWRKMRVYTTSYTAASCGKPRTHPRYGYTRLGWWLTKGVVATDPTVIPLKTKLWVPGYGLARTSDTGGGVKGKFVDLGFDEWNYESWHWWTDVYLLTPVPPRSEIRWVLPDWPRYPDRRR